MNFWLQTLSLPNSLTPNFKLTDLFWPQNLSLNTVCRKNKQHNPYNQTQAFKFPIAMLSNPDPHLPSYNSRHNAHDTGTYLHCTTGCMGLSPWLYGEVGWCSMSAKGLTSWFSPLTYPWIWFSKNTNKSCTKAKK